MVLRKEMENVLGSNERMMESAEFMEAHPILYWNLLFFFQRLCVPSHLAQWLQTMFRGAEVVVRCVYEILEMHMDDGKPLYLMGHNTPIHDRYRKEPNKVLLPHF